MVWASPEGVGFAGFGSSEEFGLCLKGTGEPRKDFQLRTCLELHCETPLTAGARQREGAKTRAEPPGFLRTVLDGSQQPTTRVAPEIKPKPHSMALQTPVKLRL